MLLSVLREQFITKTKVFKGLKEDAALVQTDGLGRLRKATCFR